MSAIAFNTQHYRAMALLRRGVLVRLGDEWRFGATSVGDSVVDALLASRKATRLFPGQTGDCIVLLDRSRGVGR
ncbi:hypothetical protein IVB40_07485 [Bradyrhizobium sp. 40]|uniref:hypothetical protein n=1 Tax=Bradyrhizobium sp. 40 TaxID=2782674 RepID=UPI001FFEB644|nr:hypothetical protein [Bradyrhizobium sp. 40]UPJ43902.1 hypothetical protein IVB40_07485 [Bradyrhizobium sp. 40]